MGNIGDSNAAAEVSWAIFEREIATPTLGIQKRPI